MVSTKRVIAEDDDQLRRFKKSKRVKIKGSVSPTHREEDNKSAGKLHEKTLSTRDDGAEGSDALSGVTAEKEAMKKKRKLKEEKTEVKQRKARGAETSQGEIQVGSSIRTGERSEDVARTTSPAKKSKKVLASRSDWRSMSRSYVQTMSLSNIPEAEIRDFLSTHQITVSDPGTKGSPLRPVTEFHHLPATNFLEKRPSPLAQFRNPTPIQAVAWPYALSGRDLIGIAETGSGKTMAFALPCIEAVSAVRCGGTKAVIVSPTRELAMQTHKELERLASMVKLRCVCLYGGASKEDQRGLLRRGCDIIVATPGRLKDLMSDGEVELNKAFYVVLDEADRMLDKGFEDDIKQILGSCPVRGERQTLMFTATWPESVQTLASTFMVNPVKIAIGAGGKETENGVVELKANPRITQKVEVLEAKDKEFRLLQIIQQHQQGKKKNDRILVFCLYKKEATRIEGFLSRKGIRVGGIHGDLRQEQRTRSLLAFKTGTTPVLVATDVAARGLDIPEVKLVINVTFPLTIEDYVHRIGRTGRAGKTGEAITMFTLQDKAHSGSLINILKGADQPVPNELLKFGTIVKKKTHDMYGSFFKEVDMTQKATKIVFD